MKLDTLLDLAKKELQDLHSAEIQITEALPKAIEKCSSKELKEVLEMHLDQTKHHIERLERAAEMLNVEIDSEKCEGMAGLVQESEKTLSTEGSPEAKDGALLCDVQKMEHYEIVGYGCLITHLEDLGFTTEAQLLEQTIDEEKGMDRKLTVLAMEKINKKVAKT